MLQGVSHSPRCLPYHNVPPPATSSRVELHSSASRGRYVTPAPSDTLLRMDRSHCLHQIPPTLLTPHSNATDELAGTLVGLPGPITTSPASPYVPHLPAPLRSQTSTQTGHALTRSPS